MSEKITKMKLGEGLNESKTDWQRLESMRDEDIDCSDIPELDESFFKRATVNFSPTKTQLTIRLDDDVLDWMKAQGKGYQSRINAILRTYYEAHQKDAR